MNERYAADWEVGDSVVVEIDEDTYEAHVDTVTITVGD